MCVHVFWCRLISSCHNGRIHGRWRTSRGSCFSSNENIPENQVLGWTKLIIKGNDRPLIHAPISVPSKTESPVCRIERYAKSKSSCKQSSLMKPSGNSHPWNPPFCGRLDVTKKLKSCIALAVILKIAIIFGHCSRRTPLPKLSSHGSSILKQFL